MWFIPSVTWNGRSPKVKELLPHIETLAEGCAFRTNGNVYIERRGDRWWVQMSGGGTQFSRTPLAAARKAVALIRILAKESVG